MADVGLKTMINGPEAFTPDNEFCLGETEVAGFFVAAGFCAHGIAGAGGIGKMMAEWIVDGRAEPRPVAHGHQPLRRGIPLAVVHARADDGELPDVLRHRLPGTRAQRRPAAAHCRPSTHGTNRRGASFGEKSGWERVNYYESNADDRYEEMRPRGWAVGSGRPATAAEHVATRTAAGLFDETSFAKIEVSGPDAARFLERVCDNHVARGVGELTYTQALNPRGGIEADFTVTRLAEQRFWVITGTAFGNHDLAWLRKQARLGDFDVALDDVTGQYVCFALWGPKAREILGSLTPADVSDEAFPFMTWQQITVGDVPVRALRVTFTGEHGWELYASTEYGARLWSALVEAGEPHGLRACGYRALESLRLEMGYRVWSTDLTPETTPYEAGLGFCVKLDKPGGFIGADALRAAKASGLTRKLCCIVLDDPRAVVLGAEPVRIGGADGEVVGRVTSGGLGYTSTRVDRLRLPADRAGGRRHPGRDQPVRRLVQRAGHGRPHPGSP